MGQRKRWLLSCWIIFILSVIPPSLGLFTFFRYEDFYQLAFIKDQMSDFSWDSLLRVVQSRFFEYYRPVALGVYWIGYLIAGNNPLILHVLVSIFYGLVAVELYWVGRFFSGELAGWLSALTFATLGPLVIISWWTGTFDIFPDLFVFLLGLLFFLSAPHHARTYVLASLFCFGMAFFARESFLLLACILLGFCLSCARFRTKAQWTIALAVFPLALTKVVVQILMGATVGQHIHQNPFEIDLSIALTNFMDYWRLLIYGHSYYFVVLCLIRPKAIDLSKYRNMGIKLVAVLAGLLIARLLKAQWAIEVGIGGLGIYFVIHSRYYERIWLLWILLGLLPVLLYDIRIQGGVMNRRVIETGLGFALFVGTTLPAHLTYMVCRLKEFRNDWPARLVNVLRSPRQIWNYVDVVCIALFMLLGLHQTWASSSIPRELRYWRSEGVLLKSVITFMGHALPQDAVLLAEPLPGMQVSSQIRDAFLLVCGRRDVDVVPLTDKAGSISQERRHVPLFAVFRRPLQPEDIPDFTVTLLHSFSESERGLAVYFYQLTKKSRL